MFTYRLPLAKLASNNIEEKKAIFVEQLFFDFPNYLLSLHGKKC